MTSHRTPHAHFTGNKMKGTTPAPQVSVSWWLCVVWLMMLTDHRSLSLEEIPSTVPIDCRQRFSSMHCSSTLTRKSAFRHKPCLTTWFVTLLGAATVSDNAATVRCCFSCGRWYRINSVVYIWVTSRPVSPGLRVMQRVYSRVVE